MITQTSGHDLETLPSVQCSWCPGWGQPQNCGAPGPICVPWPLAALFAVPARSPLPLLRLSTRSLRIVFSVYHVPALCRLCAHLEHLTAPVHVKSSAADPSSGVSHGVWVGGSGSFLSFLVSLLCAPLQYSLGTSCACLEQSITLSHGCCELCVSVSHAGP